MNPVDIVGWLGAFCILLAFFLLTHKTIRSHSWTYLGLNLAGGVLLAVETFAHESHAAFTLNVVWVIVAVYGLVWAHKR